jgi:hypothetical protein
VHAERRCRNVSWELQRQLHPYGMRTGRRPCDVVHVTVSCSHIDLNCALTLHTRILVVFLHSLVLDATAMCKLPLKCHHPQRCLMPLVEQPCGPAVDLRRAAGWQNNPLIGFSPAVSRLLCPAACCEHAASPHRLRLAIGVNHQASLKLALLCERHG